MGASSEERWAAKGSVVEVIVVCVVPVRWLGGSVGEGAL